MTHVPNVFASRCFECASRVDAFTLPLCHACVIRDELTDGVLYDALRAHAQSGLGGFISNDVSMSRGEPVM